MSSMVLGCDDVRDLAAGFVLNALDPADMAAVRDHLATCPEPHLEFAELGGVVPYLGEVVEPIEPPERLWERIRAAAAADARANEREDLAADRLIAALGRPPHAPAAPPAPAPDVATPLGAPAPPAPALPARPDTSAPAAPPPGSLPEIAGAGRTPGGPAPLAPVRDRGAWSQRLASVPAPAWVLAAAAVVLIAVLGAGNVLLQRDLVASRDYAARLDRALALASAPGSRAAVLASSEAGAAGGVAVLTSSGPGLLVVHDLAPTSGSQVYEAWVIAGNAAPVPAGSFQVGSDGRGWLETLAGPPGSETTTKLVIALTREPGPSATKPTPPILLSGTASAASQSS